MQESQHRLQTAIAAARAGGAILQQMQAEIRAREKAPRDLVTEADFASQKAIRERLMSEFPDDYFLGEEDTDAERADSERARQAGHRGWIVDPLDGTTNYVHGLDNFAVSIALREAQDMVLGVVYDPVRDHLFTAVRGEGAYCNQQRLETSSVRSVDQALVAASFAARVQPDSPEVARFVRALGACQAVRRLGSAALNLCYVAAGMLDGYWATSVKQWDVAAGLLLVQEAGGQVASIDDSPFRWDEPRFVCAGTPELCAELAKVIR